MGIEEFLREELSRYHRLRGRKDRSRLTAPQRFFAPFDLDNLVEFVASQEDVLYLPLSAVDRERLRTQYLSSQEANPVWILERFNNTAKALLDPQSLEKLNAALERVDTMFYLVKSSATGRHHPADENSACGLLLHTLRVVGMSHKLIQYLEAHNHPVPQHMRQKIYLAAFLHDSYKGHGDWSKTHYEHGHIAADKLSDILDIETCSMIRNHMAQWNSPNPTPPGTTWEQLISYADYIVSRREIYLEI